MVLYSFSSLSQTVLLVNQMLVRLHHLAAPHVLPKKKKYLNMFFPNRTLLCCDVHFFGCILLAVFGSFWLGFFAVFLVVFSWVLSCVVGCFLLVLGCVLLGFWLRYWLGSWLFVASWYQNYRICMSILFLVFFHL